VKYRHVILIKVERAEASIDTINSHDHGKQIEEYLSSCPIWRTRYWRKHINNKMKMEIIASL